jgi:hypothetical protein
MLNDEAALVIDQLNSRMVSEALLLQGAAASVLSKEGGEHFMNLVRSLNEE